MFIYQSQILNATEDLLNMQVVRSEMIYLIIYIQNALSVVEAFKYAYKKHRNTHWSVKYVINENFYIILMCMIYFFYICLFLLLFVLYI